MQEGSALTPAQDGVHPDIRVFAGGERDFAHLLLRAAGRAALLDCELPRSQIIAARDRSTKRRLIPKGHLESSPTLQPPSSNFRTKRLPGPKQCFRQSVVLNHFRVHSRFGYFAYVANFLTTDVKYHPRGEGALGALEGLTGTDACFASVQLTGGSHVFIGIFGFFSLMSRGWQ